MKKYFLSMMIVGLLYSCSNKSSEPVQEEVHQEEAGENFVTLTENQIKTAGIELGSVEQKDLENSIKANGFLKVPNQNKAFVTSVNSGIIKTLHIQPGSFVRKGQVVATLVNPDVAGIQQQLQTVNAQIHLNEIELKRQQDLVEGNAAPLKNVQRVQTELTTQKATRNALLKQLNAMGISSAGVDKGNIVTSIAIIAPISGTVSNVTAQIGSDVTPSSPIAEIVNNSKLHLDLFVFEKDLPLVKDNQIIHFTLTNNPGKEYDAKIYSIGTAFASDSKSVPVHAEVNGDKSGLIEGMSVTAVISIGSKVVPSVPNDAIVTVQGLDYVFVLTDKKDEPHGKEEKDKEPHKMDTNEDAGLTFERVQVIKGVTDVGYTEIIFVGTPPPPNAKIITKGSFFASAKMTNTEGHAH